MDKEEIKQIAYDFTTSKGDAEKLESRILSLFGVSNSTSAKDIKMYRKQGRMSGAIKREPFYKLIAQKFDENYCDYDFDILYDC
jgi:hypothetical protein